MSTKSYRVLIIDDEATIRDLISRRLERKGFTIEVAASGDEAIAKAETFKPDLAISDIRMPGLDGFAVLKKLQIPTLLITGHGDKESAIRAVDEGAFAFFEKPFDLDAVEVALRRAGEKATLQKEKAELLLHLEKLCKYQSRELEFKDQLKDSPFIGECPPILEIKETLKRLAVKPQATLLILGESGTGKEVVAHELHELSHKKSDRRPFMALNCASIPTELFESELYGHEKGSFSGAHQNRVGLAEAVGSGTLFLDEIGDMDPRHQAKLLRLLQEKVFRKVGSNTEVPFKGRIVAATHRNLKARSQEGTFREDLFYRLSLVTVELPPLRERGSDLFRISESLCKKHGLAGLSPERMAELRGYNWPGNIRELNNWIERASILGLIDSEWRVSAPVPGHPETTSLPRSAAPLDTSGKSIKELRHEILDHYEKLWIQEALKNHRGNISAASRSLGIDRKNLTKRMKELGLKIAA